MSARPYFAAHALATLLHHHRETIIVRCVTAANRDELLTRGYTIARGVLDPEQLGTCRELARQITRRQSDEEYRRRHASIGSLFDILEAPPAVDLITSPRTYGVLGHLGFPNARYEHGIVFNKLPGTPRTFWHQDGVSWNHPSSYEAAPEELIFIFYLVDTTPANGCLRVIPGSHRKRHPLHDALGGTYTPELRMMADPRSAAFATYPDEVSVPVVAGDVVILDARLLHAAHANESATERTALSLWYLADYEALPDCIRARFTWEPRRDSRLPYLPPDWPADAQARLRAVLPPRYEGACPPLAMDSKPGPALR
jgi:phytanoyl-CoA hydroxylase